MKLWANGQMIQFGERSIAFKCSRKIIVVLYLG